MGPIVNHLRRHPEWFQTRVAVTGQHREQLHQMLDAQRIQPDYDLQIMKEGQALSHILSAALIGLESIIEGEQPDIVLVQGDTHTTLAGTLAAFYRHVPVGHVEAGLRTYDKLSPWPEEINRRLTDIVSDLYFAPTHHNRDNLIREGASPSHIFVTGQPGVDAAMGAYNADHCFQETALNTLDFKVQKVIVVTAHRRENQGAPMKRMFEAIRRVADTHRDVLVVYPVHLSPTVRETAHLILAGHPGIWLLPPLGYIDMINLIARAYLVVSDSGGLQEDCCVFGTPLVLMRDTTERPEAISVGSVVLAGTNTDTVLSHIDQLITNREAYKRMREGANPFGDGRASERICGILAHHFGFFPMLPDEFPL